MFYKFRVKFFDPNIFYQKHKFGSKKQKNIDGNARTGLTFLLLTKTTALSTQALFFYEKIKRQF